MTKTEALAELALVASLVALAVFAVWVATC